MKHNLTQYGYEALYDLYVKQEKSITQICGELGCSYEGLRNKLHRLGIQVRPKGAVYPDGVLYKTTKKKLTELYVNRGMSLNAVADAIGCSESHAWTLMEKHGIPRRTKSESLKGREFTKEHREKLSATKVRNKTHVGEKNHRWSNGKSLDRAALRRKSEYNVFRQRVLRWKGDICGDCGVDLLAACECCGHKSDRHVHHIQPFADNPELRLDFNNAIVLCEKCHRARHASGTN